MREIILERLQRLAQLLDSEFELPFGIKIGWDPIVGWIPVIGGVLTSLVSGYIVVAGFQLGLPLSVLLRMALNIILDNLAAAIPVAGWFLDVVFKSNLKNIRLIESALQDPVSTQKQSQWILGGVLFACFSISVGLIFIASLLLGWLGNLVLEAIRNTQ